MAAHSSVLAWRIPGTEEPGGLPSVGSHRVGHDWRNLAAAELYTQQNYLSKMSWNKKFQPNKNWICCQQMVIKGNLENILIRKKLLYIAALKFKKEWIQIILKIDRCEWTLTVWDSNNNIWGLKNRIRIHVNSDICKMEIFILSKDVCAQLLSCVQLCTTPWTVAHQASLSMGFSRQEYWSGLPFPSPGDLPDQGWNQCLWLLLHWQVDSLPLHHLRSPLSRIRLKYLLFLDFDHWKDEKARK